VQPNWLLRERNFGKFARNLRLPEAVDHDSSQARYADGVLYLTLQKKRASQVKRLAIH
jgi:HSP20 family protein